VGRKKHGRKVERVPKRRLTWPRWLGVGDKTLWDWVNLLVLPILLSLGGIWFTGQQNKNQDEAEAQRAQVERHIQEQNTQDSALQAYLDQMSTLLLTKDLRESEDDSEVRTLARARTLTVLGRLDPSRKTVVMSFLVEAGLVQSVDEREPLIGLSGASLGEVNIEEADLSNAVLEDAKLNGAKLNRTKLNGAQMSHAALDSAELHSAQLNNTRLSGANLNNAALGDAKLSGTDLSGADLYRARLEGAALTDADLGGANLRGADLTGADLSDADLRGADLPGAFLDRADLYGANLSGANLEGAKGIPEIQLLVQASSLVEATMPDGQKFTVEDRNIPILAGQHTTDEFDPAFSFEVGERWKDNRSETPTFAEISLWSDSGQPLGQIFFTTPSHVFDPSNPSKLSMVPPPENVEEWASWFQRHPNLETSKPVRVSVGGESGVQIDVTPSSTLESYPRDLCVRPCVMLYPPVPIVSLKGGKDRFVIVDVGDKTVVIDVAAPVDKFDAFLPKAQKVLNSVEWKGTVGDSTRE
jgi:uncharacterized protein YjbI with pentapeptide repeats